MIQCQSVVAQQKMCASRQTQQIPCPFGLLEPSMGWVMPTCMGKGSSLLGPPTQTPMPSRNTHTNMLREDVVFTTWTPLSPGKLHLKLSITVCLQIFLIADALVLQKMQRVLTFKQMNEEGDAETGSVHASLRPQAEEQEPVHGPPVAWAVPSVAEEEAPLA